LDSKKVGRGGILENQVNIQETMTDLLNAWCDRRCFRALRIVLQGWPMYMGLNDEVNEFLKALKGVRSQARDELTEKELYKVDALVIQVENALKR
jgi:pyridoxal/pyridoxine/pyridoxamine kinase